MTPDEAAQSWTGGYVTVEFRVGTVAGMVGGLQGEGMPPHLIPFQLVSDEPLKGGGRFHVYLNGKLLEDLHRLALDPAEHFDGAVVRVTGTLRKVEVSGDGARRTDFQMVVLDLDKFRVVRRPSKRGLAAERPGFNGR
jgi:hypothetical protein